MAKKSYKKSGNIWINKPKAKKVSVLETLAEIKRFVYFYRDDENLAGFNTYASRLPDRSYIIAKQKYSYRPMAVLPIWMDICDPVQRPLVFNAIYESLYGVSMTPEAMENEMICKSEGADEQSKETH